MPNLKLTAHAIVRLPAPDPSRKQKLHWDTELRGFGVLCSGTTNAKTYIVQRDLPGGRTRRVAIAPVNVIDLDAARERAQLMLADFYRGIDPKAGRRADFTYVPGWPPTLRRAPICGPVRSVATAIRFRSNWPLGLDFPLRNITREMVEDRLRAIAQEVAARGHHWATLLLTRLCVVANRRTISPPIARRRAIRCRPARSSSRSFGSRSRRELAPFPPPTCRASTRVFVSSRPPSPATTCS